MTLYESLAPLYDGLFPIDPKAVDFPARLATGRNPEDGRPGEAPLVLDAGCATGGHALALADRGWRAFGIDSEPSMIRLAKEGAVSRGLAERASFAVGDIAEIQASVAERGFDLALCLGNTLPHLVSPRASDGRADGPDTAVVASFLRQARGLLAPRGSLVLQILNFSRPGLGPGFSFPELNAGGAVMRRSYRSPPDGKPGTLRFVVELARDGASQSSETSLLALAPAIVRSLLLDAGFASVAFHSSWAGDPFEATRDFFFIAVAA